MSDDNTFGGPWVFGGGPAIALVLALGISGLCSLCDTVGFDKYVNRARAHFNQAQTFSSIGDTSKVRSQLNLANEDLGHAYDFGSVTSTAKQGRYDLQFRVDSALAQLDSLSGQRQVIYNSKKL